MGESINTMLTAIWIVLAGILTAVILYPFIPTPTEFMDGLIGLL